MRKLYPFPLADQLRGRTEWQFNLQSEAGNYGWVVDSTLRGITVDLPAPLGKKAEQSLPLRLERQAVDKTHDRLTAAFGTIEPGVKLTVDASGICSPHGKTVRKPASVGLIAVTLTATELASLGTPPRPATFTEVTEPPATRPAPASCPSIVVNSGPTLVSSNRAGSTPEKLAPNA